LEPTSEARQENRDGWNFRVGLVRKTEAVELHELDVSEKNETVRNFEFNTAEESESVEIGTSNSKIET
jgi:hypothetical protein